MELKVDAKVIGDSFLGVFAGKLIPRRNATCRPDRRPCGAQGFDLDTCGWSFSFGKLISHQLNVLKRSHRAWNFGPFSLSPPLKQGTNLTNSLPIYPTKIQKSQNQTGWLKTDKTCVHLNVQTKYAVQSSDSSVKRIKTKLNPWSIHYFQVVEQKGAAFTMQETGQKPFENLLYPN